MPPKKPSIAEQAWALFDRIIERRTEVDGHSTPWRVDADELVYRADFDTLEALLGVPLHLDANTQSGVPALALDVWVAYELRRAGFDPDAVWPRESNPRIMPAAVAGLIDAATTRGGERAAIERRVRLSGTARGLVASKAKILGKNYEKQVDVVLSDWRTGPEILISTKRMDSSFGKNAANRVEESYGDAKNLRLRHPLASLGFVFGLRTTIYEKEATKAAWLVDLLTKLGHEDDAYHAVALILMEYDKDLPSDGEDVNEPESGPSDLVEAADELEAIIAEDLPAADELDAAIAALPSVRVVLDARVPAELHPARFLQSVVERTLAITPIDHHVEARARRASVGQV